ncbi:MAG: hypothetical protein KF819_01035 [Labilithrix sp.]|nr:hypothetical protein [Labilithrix sp.]
MSASAEPPRALFCAALATLAPGCDKSKPGATTIESPRTRSAEVGDGDGARDVACGPRGLPPDRHFVAEGLCARVVATQQGRLRGLTFAPNGDLLAVTVDGEIKRYRDVDRDGLFASRPPETIVWATTGADNGHDCVLDDEQLYCGSRSGVKRWRYAPHLDRGGPGEDVVVGVPEGGRHRKHPVGSWEGFLYVAGGSASTVDPLPAGHDTRRAVVKRFALDKYTPGRPLQWRDGEIVTRGIRNATALARGPAGGVAIDARGDVDRAGEDVHDDVAGEAIVSLEKGRVDRPLSSAEARSSPLAIAFVPRAPRIADALFSRWQGGAFVALHGSWDRGASTGHEVVWLSFDAEGKSADVTELPHEVVFGGGKFGAPHDGAWSWKVGDAGEDPVRPAGVAISPVDGALYVSSDNAGGSSPTLEASGSLYRIARLGR